MRERERREREREKREERERESVLRGKWCPLTPMIDKDLFWLQETANGAHLSCCAHTFTAEFHESYSQRLTEACVCEREKECVCVCVNV